MITRRGLLGAAAGAGVLAIAPGAPATAAGKGPGAWNRTTSANGWPIDPTVVTTFPIAGSNASVALRSGPTAAVLLHIARRWHYEIARIDTGEGGGVAGHSANRVVRAAFMSNYLSGTALALYPTAYPVGGSEPLEPAHEVIVRDILVDCGGTVAWGGDLNPVTASHFHIAAPPGDRTLAKIAARLDTSRPVRTRVQTPGMVADPTSPGRRAMADQLPRRR